MGALLGGAKNYNTRNHNEQETASQHLNDYICQIGGAARNDTATSLSNVTAGLFCHFCSPPLPKEN